MASETETAAKTYKVPAGNVPVLEAKIDALRRRALKLGVAPVAFSLGPIFEEVKRELHEGRMSEACASGLCLCLPRDVVYRYQTATISGETPKLAGWEFVGTIQHVELEDKTESAILRSAPGHEIPAAYRGSSQKCDHCKVERRRNDTFVVRREDGEFRQVGRTCVRDFLGGADPHAVASQLELLLSAFDLGSMSEDEGFGGGSGRALWHVDSFLSATAAVIRKDGWKSRASARENGGSATVETVTAIMMARPSSSKHDAELVRKYACEDGDLELAKKTLAWVRETLAAKAEPSDYEYNLSIACRMEGVDFRTAGIVASAIPAYKRSVEHEVLRSRRAEEWSEIVKKSVHIGTPGKREYFRLVLTGTSELESDFGVKTLHRFMTADKSVAVWFYAGAGAIGKEGEEMLVKATVKSHGDYKGARQTILSRVERVDSWYCHECRATTHLETPCEHGKKFAAKVKKELAKLQKA